MKKIDYMHSVALCVATKKERDDLMANVGNSKVYRSLVVKIYRRRERSTAWNKERAI